MKNLILILICVSAGALNAQSLADSAIAKEKAGNYKDAFSIFLSLAEKGDSKAMLDVGRFYYEGTAAPKDYEKAMDWWIKAFDKGEGMAYNNIAVLYRDGFGVPKNLKVAWALCFIGHMRGLGDDSTVSLINHNLRKIVDLIPKQDVNEACRWSEEYFKEYVRNKGKNTEKYEALKYSREFPPIIVLATY